MTDIPLHLIRPNPFRDFDLHPIDQVQVEKLVASIGADGFWASVAARPVGSLYQLAFGHHRIEAARVVGLDSVQIDVRNLTDWQMVRMLASENATQRGTTAAASLDAVAAISKVLAYSLTHHDEQTFSKIFENVGLDYTYLRGHVLGSHALGEPCILQAMPAGSFTAAQVRLALGVLKDSGRMAAIMAEVSGGNDRPPHDKIFDANCARLFKLDYHLAEFRRIVTGEVVRSYLPADKQFAFAQQIIAALGSSELTAIKLRERANVIFYEELGMPRHDMRNSPLRMSDDRVKDALNLMRRGTHSVKQCCRMLATLMAEGTDVAPEVIDRFKDYITEIDMALKSLTPERTGKRSSNLRLIINNREDVA